MIEIIDYQEKYRSYFKQLNLEWLVKYQLTEAHDLLLINDPKTMILEKSGFIWLAKVGDEIVGTAAIIATGVEEFELAKMSVTPLWQGKGISKLLLETCLLKAKQMRAKKMVLFSNHQLVKAISLYKKYGFKHIEVLDSPFLTADVKMELNF